MSRVGYFKAASATFKRDLAGLGMVFRITKDMKMYQKKDATVPMLLTEVAAKHGEKMMYYSDTTSYTFSQVDQLTNQVASFFSRQGLNKGDDVALFMTSSPDYIAIWMGLAKAGLVTALVNNNLKREPLVHAVAEVNAKAIIFDQAHAEVVASAIPLFREKKMKLFMYGDGQGGPEVGQAVKKDILSEPKRFDIVPRHFGDRLIYIYTSGTTGLPKAVVIKNSRFLMAGMATKHIMSIGESDIVYSPFPLHHTTGGMLGTSLPVVGGATSIVRSVASVSNYFPDCRTFGATVGIYIGELCRYLYGVPPTSSDRDHKLRLMFGNGLRPGLWKAFMDRFGIPEIREFYGTTEGNSQLANVDGKIGSCGFIPQIFPKALLTKLHPVSLVKCDLETGKPIRGADGFCIPCQPGESGLILGRIDQNDPLRAYEGYTKSDATAKTIMRDAFVKGDAYFVSGDLLHMDEYGYLYFQDRLGDTFRWKGENVSTTEVENVLLRFVKDCSVYGVTIPGCEGRAGMAVIQDPTGLVNVNQLLKDIRDILPKYAIPVILRITDKVSTTSTFKLTKGDFRKEGFDPTLVKDKLFYLDKMTNSYNVLDEKSYKDMVSGRIPF